MQAERLHRILEGSLLLADDTPESRREVRKPWRDPAPMTGRPESAPWEPDSDGTEPAVRRREEHGSAT